MILNTSYFICPVCGGKMFDLENSLRCFSGHSFDKSKDGYVNLLMKYAAKRCKKAAFAVASISDIPVADNSVDALAKEKIYQKPYKNPAPCFEKLGFKN